MVQLKHLILIFLVFQNSDADVCDDGSGNGFICGLLSILPIIIKTGVDELGIPPLDPFKIDSLPLNFTTDAIRGNLSLQNLTLTGLSSFEVTEATQTDLTIGIGVKVFSLIFDAEYDGDLKIMDMIKLFGKGHIELQLLDASPKLQFSIQLLPTLKIVRASIFINSPPPTIEAKFDGLFNDEFMSDIISRQFSDTADTLLKEQLDSLNGLLATVVQEFIDKYINPLLSKSNPDEFTNDDFQNIAVNVLKELSHLKNKLVL